VSVYVNDAGTLRQIARAFVNDNGTLRELSEFAVRDNATLRHVYMIQVQLPATVLAQRSASSPASFQFRSAGDFVEGSSTPSAELPLTWLVSGAAADYEYNMSAPGGDGFSTGATDTWISGGTSTTWTRTAGLGQTRTATGTLKIRRASDHVELDSCACTLECDNS